MSEALFERVEKGLGSCLKNDHLKCVYNSEDIHDTSCTTNMITDALSLIRSQQTRIAELEADQTPRVMTISEAQDAEVAWLERYVAPDDGVEPIIQPVIVRYYENGYWQCLIEQDEDPEITLFIEAFGTEWRFWTSRPTEKQRKAATWV